MSKPDLLVSMRVALRPPNTAPDNGTSCAGCTFLFTRDTGYSNYTVIGTELHCVHKRNKHLPSEVPDARVVGKHDRWSATAESRCELYAYDGRDAPELVAHKIDCDGDELMELAAAQQHALETGDMMPLLIAQYFGKK